MKAIRRTQLACVFHMCALTVFAAEPNPPDAFNNSESRIETNARVSGAHTNHLINEKSPYLRQHMHNPVDWYPWGEEAFAKARKENKPIFLSVGYSTCHWCHVMERESFENEDIAKLLNKYFVCIKVDREERPDVDRVYMTFVQATTGNGGWPMNVWLTPELKPFFGGTYLPPEKFAALANKIKAAWEADRDKIEASSDAVMRQLRKLAESPQSADDTIGASVIDDAYKQFKADFDPIYGGFGSAPKFPRPATLNFLLRYFARTGANDALAMSLLTLRKMAEGGMHDQIGGGFHRYSTDARWHVPHFEKMIYDQAQLACSYLEAYQITRDENYAEVARGILSYVKRDLSGDRGQFLSAEDADSAKEGNPEKHSEGAFYVWEEDEIVKALGKETADVFNYQYGVKKWGNVLNDPHDEFLNKNVLIASHSVADTAQKFDHSTQEISQWLAEARQKLFNVRASRPHPHLDDKAITAWNGLMISAFARAYQVLGDTSYLTAATNSASFVKSELYDPKRGLLLRRYRAGEVAIEGFADDYAFFIQGMLDLYEASFDINYLKWAIELQDKQDKLFWDTSGSGYFCTADDPSVLLRIKENHDRAEPSPNSVAVLNLQRLSQMLDKKSYQEKAAKTLASFGATMKQAPTSMPQMLCALDFSLTKPMQIIVAGKLNSSDTQAMLRVAFQKFIPNKILLLADGGKGQDFLGSHLDFIRDVEPMDGKATAFVCENYACQLPTTETNQLSSLLTRKQQPLITDKQADD